jgi:zeaxanthin glucosyltransferase
MKIVFVALSSSGHLYPTFVLAQSLKDQGHEVVITSLLDAEPFVQAAKLPFVPSCEREFPLGFMAEMQRKLSQLDGNEARAFAFKTLGDLTQSLFDDLPRVLRETRTDAVVLDDAITYLGFVPLHLGLPYVSVANALYFAFSGKAPLCFFDWPYDPSPAGIARNLEGLKLAEPAFARQKAIAHEFAERTRLSIDWTDPYVASSKFALLSQAPKEFDFDAAHWPAHFHQVGPLHINDKGRIPAEFPWDKLTGEPLIYASMGTLQNGLAYIFSAIAEAAATLPGTQLVMSVGPSLDLSGIQSLPANALVVRHAPQIQLLQRASLCITHAGLNTALESLSQGVPMVAIPITNDQPGVAARIAKSGTGIFVPVAELTPARLTETVTHVYEDPSYKQNAVRLQKAISKGKSVEKATALIEQAFGIAR